MTSKAASLDPTPDETGIICPTHPACRYEREPWTGSNVSVFPAARNGRWMAAYAVEIAGGRRHGGVNSAILRRACELHTARVPKDQALIELAEFERNLELYVSLAKGRQHAG